MNSYHFLIWALAAIAIVLTAVGGILNMTQKQSTPLLFEITSQHAWNDGLFLMLLAILLAIMVRR